MLMGNWPARHDRSCWQGCKQHKRTNNFCAFTGFHVAAFPFTLCRGLFTPKMMLCTPKNEEAFFMFIHIEGTKIRKNSKCTPNFKMWWQGFYYRFRTALTFAGSGGRCLNTKLQAECCNVFRRTRQQMLVHWNKRLIIILAFYRIPWKLPSKTPEKLALTALYKSRRHFVFRFRHSARSVMTLTSTNIKTKCFLQGSLSLSFDVT